MLVLGILMAIAIPLIGGVREAANNAKCRSNLKQLHTAIIAFSTSNEERLPNLQSDLQLLIDGGYIESESKLGICPGDGDKPKLPISSYKGGPYLDGMKKLSIRTSTPIPSSWKIPGVRIIRPGKIASDMDGSIRQGGGGNLADTPQPPLTPEEQVELDQRLLGAARSGDLETVKLSYGQGADVTAINSEDRTPLNAAAFEQSGDFSGVITFLLSIEEVGETLDFPDYQGYPPLHNLLDGISFYAEDDPNIDAMFDMAEALINAGADLTLEVRGDTPLDLALGCAPVDEDRASQLQDLINSKLNE